MSTDRSVDIRYVRLIRGSSSDFGFARPVRNSEGKPTTQGDNAGTGDVPECQRGQATRGQAMRGRRTKEGFLVFLVCQRAAN